MTIYYHISPSLNHTGVFTPDIPSNRSLFENANIPRICVSKTIEGALTSIPNGGSLLDELLGSTFGFLKLYIIDTDKLNISDDDMVDSEELYIKDLVDDANHTDEVWILKGFTVPESDQQIIIPLDWGEELIDIIPSSIVRVSIEKYNDNIEQAYLDAFDNPIPAGTKITNLKYVSTVLKKNQVIELVYMDPDSVTIWEDVIKEFHAPISVEQEDFSLKITAHDDVDIAAYVKEVIVRYTF